MEEQKRKLSIILIITIILVSLSAGGLMGYWAGFSSTSGQIKNLQSELSNIQKEIISLKETSDINSQNSTDILEKINILKNQLSTLNNQVNQLQQAPEVTTQDIAGVTGSISNLQSQLSTIQSQVNNMPVQSITYENNTYISSPNPSLSQLFEQVQESVVVIKTYARQNNSYVILQGSGFVYNYTGQLIILTNNHVINGYININVTFSNGHTYSASVKGSSPTADVAVLTTSTAPQNEYKPLTIVSSSTIKVGDPLVVVGTPYGLAGSMSNGIVSALNRTITVDQNTMTNIIQTTAPLNPGNSGGPVMDYQGQVIGMATAMVQESQGIGLAVPSDTILQKVTEIMG